MVRVMSVLNLDVIRISLHVLAATIWVGGQFLLAGLVKPLRAVDPDAPRAAANRYNLIAWPAYGLLLFTGLWNLLDTWPMRTGWHPWIEIKVLAWLLSGVGAFLHVRAKGSTVMLAIGGTLSSVFAVVTLVLGVALRFQ